VAGQAEQPARTGHRRIELLPNAEVATIDGDNHMLPLRSPNALEQLTADFVRRHPKTPDPSAAARPAAPATSPVPVS
jgi:hypothetical protein